MGDVIPFLMKTSGAGISATENDIYPIKIEEPQNIVSTREPLSIDRIYPSLHEDDLLSVALRLLAESAHKLTSAHELLAEGDEIGADDAVQRFQAMLPELFCCRKLGDSYATIISAIYHSLKNLKGTPPNSEQIETMLKITLRLKAAPFLTYNDALALVVSLQSVGLDVVPPGLQVIGEVLIG